MKKLLLLLAAISMVAAFTVSAMASTIDFYGSARYSTFYISSDSGFDDYEENDTTDADFQWQLLAATTRFGAKVKAGDGISGVIELRPGSVRHWYGTWKITPTIALHAGQQWAPINYFESNQAREDWGMGGFGALGTSRDVGLVFDISLGEGMGLKIGLMNPETDQAGTLAINSAGQKDGEVDTFLPKIEVNFSLGLSDAMKLNIAFGYNQFTDDTSDGDGEDYSVASFVMGVMFNMNLDAFYFTVDLWYASNAGDYDDDLVNAGYSSAAGNNVNNQAEAQIEDESVKNASTVGYLFVIGFKVSDTITVEGNIGYITSTAGIEDAEAVSMLTIAFTAPITLAKGVTVVPELGYISVDDANEENDDNSNATEFWLGAKWQIDF
jgi:hypothetical protein